MMIFSRNFKTAVRLFQWPKDTAGQPLSPFLAFVKEQRPKVKSDPAHMYKKSREREQVISQMWKELDPKVKYDKREEYRKAKMDAKGGF